MPGPSTLAVHAGEEADPRTGSINTPIHLSTTFLFPELADGSKAPYIYSRYENPSVEAVEAKAAALEGAQSSLLFSAGMAAIQTLCGSLAPGDVLAVQRGVYGGTTAFLSDELAPTGVKIVPFDAAKDERLPKGTKLAWVESITNPLLRVADVPKWADVAHDAGARLAVDATFASPIVQRPLALGADFVMHSATKYLAGHSDVTAGLLSSSAQDRPLLWRRRRNLGGTLDPHAAYLLGRGMKTLALRVERQCASAAAFAKAAAGLPGVKAAHYPGLSAHADHAVARRVLDGRFGGMVTLDLGTKEAAQAFRRKVRIIQPAASLGGVDSLVSLPLETSHAYATAEQRRADGVGDGLARISIGIEDVEDLVEDAAQALE